MTDSRSRSIGVVILFGLFCPVPVLGKPFSVVAPKRLTICSSSWPGSWPGRFESDGWSWILVDEPVDAEDLRRVEITHWSSHPDVELRTELYLSPYRLREKWAGALGQGDRVALAAFPGRTRHPDDDSPHWFWRWRWPEGHHAIERFSTLVRLGSHDARFDTEVVFDPGCTHHPESTAAQLIVATSGGPPATPMIAELRQYPPEQELQAKRNELLALLLALGWDQSKHPQLVEMTILGYPIEVVVDKILRSMLGVNVQLAPELERRRIVTFAADRAPLVDALVLLAHQESLRFEVTDGTLFICDDTERAASKLRRPRRGFRAPRKRPPYASETHFARAARSPTRATRRVLTSSRRRRTIRGGAVTTSPSTGI